MERSGEKEKGKGKGSKMRGKEGEGEGQGGDSPWLLLTPPDMKSWKKNIT